MKAKDIAKDLKFNFRKELYENDKIIEIEFNDGNGTRIVISKEKIEYVEKHNRKELPTSLLKLVNKVIEELGWLDER